MTQTTLTLVVAMTVDDQERIKAGDRYTAGDRLAGAVSQFCNKHAFPYSDTFVSIGVFDGNVPTNNNVRLYALKLGSLIGKPGVLAHLNIEIVLDDIEVVAEGDFQDIASNGHAADKNPNDSSRRYVKKIHLVAGDTAQRIAALLAAARSVLNPHYAEARMFRPLVKGDIQHYEVA
jgi:hypothetical protein